MLITYKFVPKKRKKTGWKRERNKQSNRNWKLDSDVASHYLLAISGWQHKAWLVTEEFFAKCWMWIIEIHFIQHSDEKFTNTNLLYANFGFVTQTFFIKMSDQWLECGLIYIWHLYSKYIFVKLINALTEGVKVLHHTVFSF